MRKSSGQNRHACAPYTRVPPPTVDALPFHSGSVARTAVSATNRGLPAAGGSTWRSSPVHTRALRV